MMNIVYTRFMGAFEVLVATDAGDRYPTAGLATHGRHKPDFSAFDEKPKTSYQRALDRDGALRQRLSKSNLRLVSND